jgi:hypothetical protein
MFQLMWGAHGSSGLRKQELVTCHLVKLFECGKWKGNRENWLKFFSTFMFLFLVYVSMFIYHKKIKTILDTCGSAVRALSLPHFPSFQHRRVTTKLCFRHSVLILIFVWKAYEKPQENVSVKRWKIAAE